MIDRRNLIFILVSAAIFIDMMVYTLVIPILPSYSLHLGADTIMIGIIFGSFSISLLLFSIPFGIISDKIGRQQFMVLGMLLLAITNVIFAVSGNIYVLIIARLLQGMSGAATWSAGLAMLADTFEPGERGRRLGLAMSVMSVGTLLGPAVGGILYDSLGYAPTFIIPSVMAFIVGLLFLMVKQPPPSVLRVSFGDRIAPFLRTPWMSAVIVLAIVFGAATYGILEPYMPVYLYRSFSATPTIIGLTFGAMSLLSVIGQPIVGKLYDARGGRPLIAAGLICSALVIVVCVMMPSLYSTAAIFSLLGITMGFALTPMLPLMSDLYGGEGDSNSRGLVYGVYNTLFSLGLAIGPFAGGLLVAAFTFRDTLFAQALILIIMGLASYAVIRQPEVVRKLY
jgi:DHA1 family multidrug resistance protein-like MFS transporter